MRTTPADTVSARGGACLDADVLAAYIEGTSSAAERAAAECHVDTCSKCYAELAVLLRCCLPTPESTDVAPAPVAIGDSLGRYVVKEWLGAGGMGVVYRASDPSLKRDVALKIVRDAAPAVAGATQARLARLLSEAVHMAKLTHPNVIRVYDAGTDHGRTWVAQELVEGVTLAQWERAEGRTVGEVVDRYVEAGRGLAAAHAAGILHRDFKPANVLVGDDGRAKVGDFGLALAFSSEDREVATAEDSSAAGTPRYMAPEQHGGIASARSDQYAFALALAEALEHLARTSGGRTPRNLRRALERARAKAPEDRFPSLDALLAAIAPRPPGRRALVVVMVATCLSLVTALGMGATKRAPPCEGLGADLDGLRATLAAPSAWSRVDGATATTLRARLQVWTQQWTDARVRACQDTRVRGVQSEAALDLRMRCLSEERHEVETLVSAIARADGPPVEPAVLRGTLPAPVACDDLRLQEARLRPPDDASASSAVDAARQRLAEGRALAYLRRWTEAESTVNGVVDEARRLGYRPLEADALLALGWIMGLHGPVDKAIATLHAAHRAAVASHHDEVAAHSLVLLVEHLAIQAGRLDEAREVGLEAVAALEARGSDDTLSAYLETTLGDIPFEAGQFGEALPHFDRALGFLARARAAGRPLEVTEAEVIRLRGVCLVETGRVDEGAAAVEEGVHAAERVTREVPSTITMVAAGLDDLARARAVQGRLEDALTTRRRSVSLAIEARGAVHRDVALGTLGMAGDLEALGRWGEAIAAYDRAGAIAATLFRPQHPTAMRARLGGAYARLVQGGLDAAGLASVRASLEQDRKTPAITALERARFEMALARLELAARGRAGCASAQPHFDAGLELLERAAASQFLLPHERADAARAFWATSSCAARP